MKKWVVAFVSLTLTVALVAGARALTGGSFRPAAASESRPSTAAFLDGTRSADGTGSGAAALTAVLEDTLRADDVAAQANAASIPVATPSEPVPEATPPEAASAPAPVAAAPIAAPPPPAAAPAAPAVRAAAPAPVAPAPVAAPVAAAPAPAACPATWFCYPRLGIAGPIIPYSDCLGSTDIGGAIRSFTCISPYYLMGHAYTQFGAVTRWQAGDVVFASGRRFVISGAFVQNACEAPAGAAPLSLQTSLTSGSCGRVLVVQGR